MASKISVTLQYGNIKELYMMEKTDQPHVSDFLLWRFSKFLIQDDFEVDVVH